jgi:UDP-2,3-diacylglucosamine pyrophosphatase LpxH
MIRKWWSWLGALLTTLLTLRYLLSRVRPVILKPTEHHTSELNGALTTLGIRRIVVSDLHLGAGDRLDDFNADREFAEFLTLYAATEPTELILAGDTFEFLQVTLPDVPDFEWTPRAAERRLSVILDAHPLVIDALVRFIRSDGMYLTLLIGNHDFEIHYRSAKRTLSSRLGLAVDDPRLRYGIRYIGEGMFMEHGNQFEQWNSFVRFDGISQPFELVRGTLAVKNVINPLERSSLPIAPYIDNVKPSSAFLWHLLGLARLRDLQVVGFVLRGVVLTIRSMLVPLSYRKSESLDESINTVRHLQNQRRIKRALDTTRRVVERRSERPQSSVPPYLVNHIERESRRQLHREMREFNVSVLREVVHIAHQPKHATTRVFICGHTHMAQHVAFNERQTYINVGTWTDVVIDITTGKRQTQRCPFLEIRVDGQGGLEHAFMVWRGSETPPTLWEPEGMGRPRLMRTSHSPARFSSDGVTIRTWKNEGEQQ